MFAKLIALFALAASAVAAPERMEKRQDINQLLTLASLAGISLPTDPAVLLQLGPVASNLAAALPTSSVLAVLETAAPRSFLSLVVHDASYAHSFESAFAAGSSPSWFNALPTDVKSYLHTYTGFGGLATAAGAVESAEAKVTSESGAARTNIASSTVEASSRAAAATSTPSSTAASGVSNSNTSTSSASTATSKATSTTGGSISSGTAVGGSSAAPARATTTGGAIRLTGATAASCAGLVGIFAVAVML